MWWCSLKLLCARSISAGQVRNSSDAQQHLRGLRFGGWLCHSRATPVSTTDTKGPTGRVTIVWWLENDGLAYSDLP
jgi:hypothetical protein